MKETISAVHELFFYLFEDFLLSSFIHLQLFWRLFCEWTPLGSCCLGVGLCPRLPSMLSNVSSSHTSILILPHLLRSSLLCYHLIPPPAFTAGIAVPPWQSSFSSAKVCTALLHLSQASHEMVSKVRDAEFDPGWDRAPELQDYSLALYPLRYHIPLSCLIPK